MSKSLTTIIILGLLFIEIALAVSACSSQPSAAQVQTAVAGTLGAPPAEPVVVTQLVEVTRVMEVTKIVEVIVAATANPTEKTTPTVQPAATLEATPTAEASLAPTSAIPPTATPLEASGPLGLSFNQLLKKYADMTDLQKQAFVASLPGKTVSWTAQVYNITTDGIIILDNPYEAGRVTLKGVPIETALKIDTGMLVDFSGIIESFSGAFFPDIVIVDTQILRYYLPPSATPTSTR